MGKLIEAFGRIQDQKAAQRWADLDPDGGLYREVLREFAEATHLRYGRTSRLKSLDEQERTLDRFESGSFAHTRARYGIWR